MRYGLIAGNGRFPLLALETARREGHEIVVVAIENEAAPDLEQYASAFHWINIGQLAKLIAIFQRENVSEVMMTGQVRHVKRTAPQLLRHAENDQRPDGAVPE